MNSRPCRRWLPAALTCLLLVGVFAPMAALGQSTATRQQNQLSALVGAADSSKSYAASVVDFAVASGLSVSSSQSQLNRGDSLLATAQADLQAGTNLAAGVQAAQAAMADYAAAATSSSVALTNAGLTASVDYDAALSAVAEVNSTVNVMASVEAHACAGASTATPEVQAVTQACAQVAASLLSARAELDQAASLLVQTKGTVTASASISQALALVAQARAEVQACQPLILTVASYTYSLRGQAYLAAVVDPLYASANATVMTEGSLIANITAYQAAWGAYAESQASAAASVGSSAASLQTAISGVDKSATSSDINSSEGTAGQLKSDLQVLLTLSEVAALPGLVADINSAINAVGSYQSALATAQAWSGMYDQTQLSSFGAYLSQGTSDEGAVQTTGSAYLASYNVVVSDLDGVATLLGLPPVKAVLSLPVSQTVSSVSTSLSAETSAMGTVGADITSLNAVASSAEPAVVVSGDLLATASGVSASGGAYLNSTAKATLGEVSARAVTAAQAAQSYLTSVGDLLQSSIGTCSSVVASLNASAASLAAQTQDSASAAAAALASVQSDAKIRVTVIASGQADVTQALQLFSAQDVSAGAAAMANASLEFQAASGPSPRA